MERRRRRGRHFLAALWILLSAVCLLVFLYTINVYTAELHANQARCKTCLSFSCFKSFTS